MRFPHRGSLDPHGVAPPYNLLLILPETLSFNETVYEFWECGFRSFYPVGLWAVPRLLQCVSKKMKLLEKALDSITDLSDLPYRPSYLDKNNNVIHLEQGL
jgi:hypothetical protein